MNSAALPKVAAALRPLVADRLRGLNREQATQLRQAIRYVEAGDRLMAGQWLWLAKASAPDHPEVMRWCGLHHFALGEWKPAAECLTHADRHRPDDFVLLSPLAAALYDAGECASARDALVQAQRHARGAGQWWALCLEFDRQAMAEEARAAADQVLRLDSSITAARLQRARSATALGDRATTVSA